MVTSGPIRLAYHKQPRMRRIPVDCLAATSLGLCILAATMWWDSQSCIRGGPLGKWIWSSSNGFFVLRHYAMGLSTGKTNSLVIYWEARGHFYVATFEREDAAGRMYVKDFGVG